MKTRRAYSASLSADQRPLMLNVTATVAAVFCVTSVMLNASEGAYRTSILAILVAFLGQALVMRVARSANTRSIANVGVIWSAKLILTIAVLQLGWMPQLDASTSAVWGYDPQRFYIQAKELIEHNWSTEFVSLNYVGVLYVYASVYTIFGFNPFAPALVNCFISLVAALVMITFVLRCASVGAQKRAWVLGLALLVPEAVWFDVMTSREAAMGALLCLAIAFIGFYVASRRPFKVFEVLVIVACSAAIALLRGSMLMSVALTTILLLLLVPGLWRRAAERVVLVSICGVMLVLAPIATELMGGYAFRFTDIVQIGDPTRENIAHGTGVTWSQNSIGMLLIPHGLIQAVLFTPIRAVLYLLSPIPNVGVSVKALLAGSWEAWQGLTATISAGLYIISIPFAAASAYDAWQSRRYNPLKVAVHCGCWVVLASIAGGNIIIHERYRTMVTMLLMTCAWLGMFDCPRHYVRRAAFMWAVILAAGGLFYIGYKL